MSVVFRRLIWVLAIVVVLSPIGASPLFAQSPGPAQVTVATAIERTDVSAGRAFVGSFEPRRKSSIGSAVSGRVVEFLVNEGDRVEKGQPLAKLLTRNLEIQIAAARAELDLRKHEVTELKNGSREEERRQAENRMKAAEATVKWSQQKLDRTKELVRRNATTRDQLDDDASGLEVATDTLATAKATFDLVVAGPRPEKIAQAQARVAAAQEEVNRLLDLLEKHTITSPFGGFVVAEHTEVGQWIESGKLVADVVEVDPIEIRVQVLETYVTKLLIGSSARIEIDALPDKAFVGSVTAIVPLADEKSRSFPVKVTVKNVKRPDGTYLLKPGMFARVWLPVDKKSRATLVPKDSLVLGGPQPIVFVVDKDEKSSKPNVRPVPVQLGIAADSWIEVRGDVKAGQQVVVEGNERLRPGAEIQIIPSKIEPPRESVAASAKSRAEAESE